MGAKAKFREMCRLVSKRLVTEHGYESMKHRLLSRTDGLRRRVLFDPSRWADDECYPFNVVLSLSLPMLDSGPPTEEQWDVKFESGGTVGPRPGQGERSELFPDTDVPEFVERVVWPVISLGMREFLERYDTPQRLYHLVAFDEDELNRMGTWPNPFRLVVPWSTLSRLETAAVYAYALGLDSEVPGLLKQLQVAASESSSEEFLPNLLGNIERARRGEFLART